MIDVVIGNIAHQDVEAIVNAANSSLLGGSGVDGAIHHAAGPKLLEECETLNGCETGDAKITRGYNLKAKNIIHTVGPVWKGGDHDEDALLESCYTRSLAVAKKHRISSIAFPAISTGIYCFPLQRATRIAVQTVTKFLSENNSIEKVIFVCFDRPAYQAYRKFVN